MSTTWIKVAYAVLLGLVVAMTVGFGVATFITEPRAPQPVGITFTALNDQNASDQTASRQEKQIDSFYQDATTQRANYPEYQRNIFMLFVGIGLLVAVVGVALPAVVNYLRLGLILGGGMLATAGIYMAVKTIPNAIPPTSSILTLLGLGQPTVLDAAGRFLRFAVSVVGFLLLVFVGLWRLTDWAVAPRIVAAPAPAGGTTVIVTPPAPGDMPVSPPSPPGGADRWARPDERPPAAPSYTPPVYEPPSPPSAPPSAPGTPTTPPAFVAAEPSAPAPAQAAAPVVETPTVVETRDTAAPRPSDDASERRDTAPL